MPFDASSMDDNASVTSTISSIFGGDLGDDIVFLRMKRLRIISDGRILEDEYNNVLNLSHDDSCFPYSVDFDVCRRKWLECVLEYVATARAMYNEDKICYLHFKAMIKSLPKLEKSWKATAYFDPDLCEEYKTPYPDHIELLASLMCGNTSREFTATPASCSSPELPSGPSSGPNIDAWLRDAEGSSTSGAGLPAKNTVEAEIETAIAAEPPRATAVEAEAEPEDATETPEVTATTPNASLRHISSSNTTMVDLFDGLKREMERLSRENEQLKQQLANAQKSAAVRANAEKREACRLKQAAIQRAENAEKERDEIIDGFIHARIRHLSSQITNKSHSCSTHIEQRKINLQSWLASLQPKDSSTGSEFRPITGGKSSKNLTFHPSKARETFHLCRRLLKSSHCIDSRKLMETSLPENIACIVSESQVN